MATIRIDYDSGQWFEVHLDDDAASTIAATIEAFIDFLNLRGFKRILEDNK